MERHFLLGHSVHPPHPPPPLSAGEGWVEPQLLKGVAGKKGVIFFRVEGVAISTHKKFKIWNI